MAEEDNSLAQPTKRRRLLSRRELRHQGTRIVRVGSANVLQTNRGQYNFSTVHGASLEDPTPAEPEHEPIDAPESPTEAVCVEEDDDIASSAATAGRQRANKPAQRLRRARADKANDGDSDGNIVSSTATPKRRRVYKLTQMSERAQRLRVSPNQRRRSAPLFQVDRLLAQSPGLPPPLDLDQNILSFPEQSLLNPPGRRTLTRQWTPMRKVPEKLRMTNRRPPPVFGFGFGQKT